MFKEPAMFQDREAAGRALSRRVSEFLTDSPTTMTSTSTRKPKAPVVVAIPRGGIPLSRIVADDLDLDLDICLVRRIPGPTSRRGASIAAVTEQGDILLSQPSSWGVSRKYMECARAKLLEDINRRRRLYNTKPMSLRKRDVIIVDDCIASGASMLAAIHSVKKQKPSRIIIASPFCSSEAKARLVGKCDALLILYVPPVFNACAQFYISFPPVTDLEVIDCLLAQRNRMLGSNTPTRSDAEALRRMRHQLSDQSASPRGLVHRDSCGLEDGGDANEPKSRASSGSFNSTSSHEDASELKAGDEDEGQDSFRVHRAISWQNALEMDPEEAAALGFAPPVEISADQSTLEFALGDSSVNSAADETRLSDTMVEVVGSQ